MEIKLLEKAELDGIERIAVGAVILDHNLPPYILLLSRNPDDFLGGIDELPSGEVEAAESLAVALRRELLEETGLKVVNITGYIGSFDYLSVGGKTTRQFYFLIVPDRFEVKVSPAEHSGFNWIRITELDRTKLTPGVKTLLEQYYRLAKYIKL